MSVIVKSNLYLVNQLSKEAMVKAAISVGILTTGYAQDLCPVSPGGGNLRNSITYAYNDEEGHTVTLIVGSEQKVINGTLVNYAPYVELGHHQEPGKYVPAIGKRLVRSWVPGKPFLRTAFENHTEVIENIILDALSE